MKRILLLFLVLFAQHSSAQDMWGIANSNYAGTAGMNLNPASMMLTPYCWEASLVTVNISVENNYIGLVKDKYLQCNSRNRMQWRIKSSILIMMAEEKHLMPT